jgi:hypothetical protein
LNGTAFLLVLLALSGVAYGGGNNDDYCQNHDPQGVPEIDPGSIASAMALLGGGALLLTSRRRRS